MQPSFVHPALVLCERHCRPVSFRYSASRACDGLCTDCVAECRSPERGRVEQGTEESRRRLDGDGKERARGQAAAELLYICALWGGAKIKQELSCIRTEGYVSLWDVMQSSSTSSEGHRGRGSLGPDQQTLIREEKIDDMDLTLIRLVYQNLHHGGGDGCRCSRCNAVWEMVKVRNDIYHSNNLGTIDFQLSQENFDRLCLRMLRALQQLLDESEQPACVAHINNALAKIAADREAECEVKDHSESRKKIEEETRELEKKAQQKETELGQVKEERNKLEKEVEQKKSEWEKKKKRKESYAKRQAAAKRPKVVKEEKLAPAKVPIASCLIRSRLDFILFCQLASGQAQI